MDEATRRMIESHDALEGNREEIGQSRDELTESLAELKRREVPRVSLELTEDELRFLEEVIGESRTDDGRPGGLEVYEKIKQLLLIETGMGGRFHR